MNTRRHTQRITYETLLICTSEKCEHMKMILQVLHFQVNIHMNSLLFCFLFFFPIGLPSFSGKCSHEFTFFFGGYIGKVCQNKL